MYLASASDHTSLEPRKRGPADRAGPRSGSEVVFPVDRSASLRRGPALHHLRSPSPWSPLEALGADHVVSDSGATGSHVTLQDPSACSAAQEATSKPCTV